jgi:glycosyltransferase involved in cell wall biosynthesis
MSEQKNIVTTLDTEKSNTTPIITEYSKYNDIAILVSSTQYPGYGGAATNAYALIKSLRTNGYNVAGLFFHPDINVHYDPDNIGGIYISKYIDVKVEQYTSIYNNVVNYLGKKPDLTLAKNYAAPVFCKHIFNNYVVYLVSGIQHLSDLKLTPPEFLDDNYIVTYTFPREILCNTVSDMIILNSELSKALFEKIYPECKNKIYKTVVDTSNHLNIDDVFNANRRLNMHRRYDILLCCSNLTRVIKNNMFLVDVLNDPRFDKYSKCIIGEENQKFTTIPNSHCIGLKQQDCFKYMTKSKILLFPSLFDANPNTVREAYSLGCMPLITNNIGYSELFPEVLVCKTFNKDEWIDKIIYLMENYKRIKNIKIPYNTQENIHNLIPNIIDQL